MTWGMCLLVCGVITCVGFAATALIGDAVDRVGRELRLLRHELERGLCSRDDLAVDPTSAGVAVAGVGLDRDEPDDAAFGKADGAEPVAGGVGGKPGFGIEPEAHGEGSPEL